MSKRGEELRALRVLVVPRLTVTELARVIGVDRATLTQWESREVVDDERAARYEAAISQILTSRKSAS